MWSFLILLDDWMQNLLKTIIPIIITITILLRTPLIHFQVTLGLPPVVLLPWPLPLVLAHCIKIPPSLDNHCSEPKLKLHHRLLPPPSQVPPLMQPPLRNNQPLLQLLPRLDLM